MPDFIGQLEVGGQRRAPSAVAAMGTAGPGRAATARSWCRRGIPSGIVLASLSLRGPLVVNRFSIAGTVRSDGEELEAVGASLEGTRDIRRDTDGVEGMHLGDVVV